jgi:tryptophan synthase alpha chain
MNLLDNTFENLKINNKKAFVAYITAGDPSYAQSLKIVDVLVEAGVDILELGVPFSDPLADGTANQLAADRALKAGMTSLKVLDFASDIRKKYPKLPLVLFTYMNPVAYLKNISFENFCSQAVKSGIDAILPLDLPPEELDSECSPGISFRNALEKSNLKNVVLVAPTTKQNRLKKLMNDQTSFVYYVSKEGVTGEGTSFINNFSDKIKNIKAISNLPVVVGFGISTPEHVATAATDVDGVVVGSAIVRQIEGIANNTKTMENLKNFVSSMTSALS